MEGPSLLILKEELQKFRGRKILKVSGNTQQPKELLQGRTLKTIDTWGKNLFLSFDKKGSPPILTKTHFMMFGSYRIDEPKDRVPRLQLDFQNGSIYFYACSIRFDADEYFKNLDRAVDLMSEGWNRKHVVDLLKKKKKAPLCDVLLDQTLFAGSGNIVKNEVLFNLRLHPLTALSKIADRDLPKLAEAVHDYCWHFYEWKKKFELRRHWQVYRRSRCPLCDTKLNHEELGRMKRRTFYCKKHQPRIAKMKRLTVHDVLPPAAPFKGAEPRLDH